MRQGIATLSLLTLIAGPASADFLRWSATQEDDPFATKERMIMDYMDSTDSGMLIICEPASDSLTLRLALPISAASHRIPTYIFNEQVQIDDFSSHILSADDVTLGNGNIGIDSELAGESARRLLDEMVKARRSFYIKVSDVTETIRLPVNGSTAAARKMLDFCMKEAAPLKQQQHAPDDQAKPRTIDWHAYKQFRDLGEWGDSLPKNRDGAIYRIALARAYAQNCQQVRINKQAKNEVAKEWNIEMAPGSADEKWLNEATRRETIYYETAELSESEICGFANEAFGPTGTNVKNLLIPVD